VISKDVQGGRKEIHRQECNTVPFAQPLTYSAITSQLLQSMILDADHIARSCEIFQQKDRYSIHIKIWSTIRKMLYLACILGCC